MSRCERSNTHRANRPQSNGATQVQTHRGGNAQGTVRYMRQVVHRSKLKTVEVVPNDVEEPVLWWPKSHTVSCKIHGASK